MQEPQQQGAPIVVEVPGLGEVEFPAGTSEATMKAAIARALKGAEPVVPKGPLPTLTGFGGPGLAQWARGHQNVSHDDADRAVRRVAPAAAAAGAGLFTGGLGFIPAMATEGAAAGLTSAALGNSQSTSIADAALNALPGGLGRLVRGGGNMLRGMAARRMPTSRMVASRETIPGRPGTPASTIVDEFGQPMRPAVPPTPDRSVRSVRTVAVPPQDPTPRFTGGDAAEALFNLNAGTMARQAFRHAPGPSLDRAGRSMVNQAPTIDALARAFIMQLLGKSPQ